MRTPSPPYCGLDLAPPLADRFVLGVASSTTARYFSAYPSDPASRRAPCPPKLIERWLQVRLGCLRLSPSCPFRLLHTFLSLRPARHYPRLWIRRSSSERRRDFNPPDLGAAQRTLWWSPTSHARASSATAPRLPDADQNIFVTGQTRDIPGSDAILLRVMWSSTPAGRQCLA